MELREVVYAVLAAALGVVPELWTALVAPWTAERISSKREAIVATRKDVIDYYKDHYKEAQSNFRYFGQLRAAIAWLPASVTLLIVGAIMTSLNIYTIPMIGFAVVVVAIFLANMVLQKEQRASLAMSRACEEKILETFKLPDTEPAQNIDVLTFSGLKARAAAIDRIPRVLVKLDAPSWALAAYCAILVALSVVIIVYSGALSGG